MAQSLVYAIDVGTTKIVAVAGRSDGRGAAEVLAMGESASHGLKRGVVVDREAAAKSIARAIDACGVVGGPVSVGIAGSHITSFNTEVTLLNRSRNLTITEKFLQRLDEEAHRLDLDEDQQVIHVIPRGYVLDGSEGVTHPLGLAARRVTLRAHVVSGAVFSIQNLLQAVEDTGVTVSRVVLEPLAAAESCISEAEREAGVALLDVGGGTSDIAAFVGGVLTHTAIIPIGGESFTSDVSYGLKVPFDAAERLKRRYGTVLPKIVDPVAAIKLDRRYYNAHFMSQILEYRAREVLDYARESLLAARVKNRLPGGIVLTGGGSQLNGLVELSEEVLGMRARTVKPQYWRGNPKLLSKPQYATAAGLLYFSTEDHNVESQGKGAAPTSFGSIVSAIKSWFRGG
ncbi:MAG: cell division protein FtsA [Rubrobacteraceae bacterium]